MELHSWPQPCSVMYCRHLFASRLALESLFSEQQGQWYRSPASLWARTAISTWGKPTSIAQGCNRFARERDLTNTYPKGVVPSGLLELLELTRARSIQSPRPHAALCTMSAWGLAGDHVPWAAARDLFSGRWVFAGFAGSPGHQPGVRARLLMPLCPGGGLSQSSVLTQPLLRGGFSNFAERLFCAPDACSCSQFPCKLLPRARCFQLVLGNIPLFTSSFFSPSPPFCVSLQGQGLNNLSPEIFAIWSLVTGRAYEENIHTDKVFFCCKLLLVSSWSKIKKQRWKLITGSLSYEFFSCHRLFVEAWRVESFTLCIIFSSEQ